MVVREQAASQYGTVEAAAKTLPSTARKADEKELLLPAPRPLWQPKAMPHSLCCPGVRRDHDAALLHSGVAGFERLGETSTRGDVAARQERANATGGMFRPC
mmetsp:Transcript_41140/g.105181  ORF Transcript_41140/g.105181 Transcript_41140/m.105181 type:complete len:102 (-) Transcript_41140:122-427(-)